MFDEQKFLSKYLEILKLIDYDITLYKMLTSVGQNPQSFNVVISDILNKMDKTELILLLSQSIKHDMSECRRGDDELWDKIENSKNEYMDVDND